MATNLKFQERLEKKLDRIEERQLAMGVTLAAQHVTLQEHIRRTELLESVVPPLAKEVASIKVGARTVLKVIALVSTLAGIAAAVVKFL